MNEQFRHMRETQISDSNERTATLLARGCADKKQVSVACEGARPSSQLSRHSWNKKKRRLDWYGLKMNEFKPSTWWHGRLKGTQASILGGCELLLSNIIIILCIKSLHPLLNLWFTICRKTATLTQKWPWQQYLRKTNIAWMTRYV